MTIRPRNLVVLLICLSLTPALTAAAEDPTYKTVEVDEFEKMTAQKKDDRPIIILDVRTPEEYKAGHLKDAVLIDYKSKEFDQKIKALDKSRTYLVYCGSGYRSSSACKKLQSLDFPDLYNLKGGITAWQKAGKPTEK